MEWQLLCRSTPRNLQFVVCLLLILTPGFLNNAKRMMDILRVKDVHFCYHILATVGGIFCCPTCCLFCCYFCLFLLLLCVSGEDIAWFDYLELIRPFLKTSVDIQVDYVIKDRPKLFSG